jgi:hypothetical protein
MRVPTARARQNYAERVATVVCAESKTPRFRRAGCESAEALLLRRLLLLAPTTVALVKTLQPTTWRP